VRDATTSSSSASRPAWSSPGQAYADIRNGEAWLIGASISDYAQAGPLGPQSDRDRKLLLHRSEIDSLYGKVREKGLTLVPTRMYFKDGRVKVEVALARGRERADKRRVVAERDAQRDIERALKRRR
jgi:SsrA-binding protein